MSIIPPPADDEFDATSPSRTVQSIPQSTSAVPPPQDQTDLAQLAAQFYAIRQRIIEALRRCGGEQFIYALIEYTQPPNIKLAFSRALEYEGDPILIFIKALQYYLTVMYLEPTPVVSSGGRRGGRRASGGEEDVMDQAELERKVQEEVIRQVVARALEEEDKKKQMQTQNPLQTLFIQALQQQLQKSLAGGFGIGGALTTPSQQSQKSETQKERRKIVDVDSI